MLKELEATLERQLNGRIRGLARWLRFHSSKGEKELEDVLCELRDARRLEEQNPNRIIEIAEDSDAPLGADGAPLPEFDLLVAAPDGKIDWNIEVKNAKRQELWRAEQVSDVVQAVTEKLRRRADAGRPIQGNTEASIHCRIPFGPRLRKGAIRDISLDGTVSRSRPDGTPIGSHNLFDRIADKLGTLDGQQHLDRVTLVCEDGHQIVFTRQNAKWARTS